MLVLKVAAGEFYCVRLLVPLGRGGKSCLFAGLPICASIVCHGKDNTVGVNEVEGGGGEAPLAVGILSSYFIAWILILELELHQGS